MRALLVFVEGQADAQLVLRSLGQSAKATFDKRKPEDLPTPFGKSSGALLPVAGLIPQWNLRAAARRTLQASAEDNEPVFQAAAVIPADSREPDRPDLAFIVRMGGDRKSNEVLSLLNTLRLTFTSNIRLDVERVACAFVFDADTPSHHGEESGDCVTLRERRFAVDYGSVLGGISPPQHGAWAASSPIPFGLFVLHDRAAPERTGTLESVLEPALMVDPVWGSRLSDAEALLKRHERPGDAVIQSPTDRAKARLAIGGQWSEPGSSLAQILRKGEPKKLPAVPDAAFQSVEAVALAKFLMSIPW